jgi:hypothetical protein
MITIYNKSKLTFSTPAGDIKPLSFLEIKDEELAEKLLKSYPKYLNDTGLSANSKVVAENKALKKELEEMKKKKKSSKKKDEEEAKEISKEETKESSEK